MGAQTGFVCRISTELSSLVFAAFGIGDQLASNCRLILEGFQVAPASISCILSHVPRSTSFHGDPSRLPILQRPCLIVENPHEDVKNVANDARSVTSAQVDVDDAQMRIVSVLVIPSRMA